MEVELIIRQAMPENAPTVVALLEQVQQETEYLQMERLSTSQQAILLAQYAESNNSLMLLAELSGQVVGLANLRALSSKKAELGVCVCRAYWGNGIGTALVTDLIDFANMVGIEQLVLEVMRANRRAIHLYQSLSFVENRDKSTVESIWMTREI